MSSMKKRVVLVGDSGCGKSALAYKLTENLFLDFYEPTGFDDFQTELLTDKGSCKLTILDTSGNHDDGNIRALTYKACDAVIICFDLTDQSSLFNVEKFWLPELKKLCPNVPTYIAGCKRDAVCENCCTCGYDCCIQTQKEFLEIIQRTGAVAYTECSAVLKDDGVERLFQVVVKTCNQKKKSAKQMITKIKKQSKCVRRRLSVLSK